MAGYIGKSQVVTQVNGYTQTEADSKFIEGDDTLYVDETNDRVGIGTSSPTDKLNISSGSNQIGLDTGNQATYGTLDLGHFTNGAFIGTQAGSNAASNLLRLGTSGTERMRIDSSGNVLVGKTSASTTSLGVEARANGLFAANKSGGASGYFGRQASDGSIVELNKDGTTVGSIGSYSGDNLTIGTGAAGVRFDVGLNTIIPHNVTTNVNSDATTNLGHSAVRFKDLHLSGTVNGSVAAPSLFTYNHVGSLSPTPTVFTTRVGLQNAGLVTGGIYVFCAHLSAWNTGITSYHLQGVTKPWAFTTVTSNNTSIVTIGDFLFQGHAFNPTVTIKYRMVSNAAGANQEFLVSSATTSSSDFAVGAGNGRELTISVKRIA